MEKNLGRGQRLKSVIKDYHEKRPENLQDQLLKISSYEYTNEFIERFCDELANKEAESSHASVLSNRTDPQRSKIVEIQSQAMWNYFEEFPTLGSQASIGVERERDSASSETTASFSEKVTANISKSPQKPSNTIKGIGRGKRLRMVTDSITPSPGTSGSDIGMACGTDYTNQSIERFVKELTEKNENMKD